MRCSIKSLYPYKPNHAFQYKKLPKLKKEPVWVPFKWRRRWDSNPRNARTFDGFQDRSDQPLWHFSKQLLSDVLLFYQLNLNCQGLFYKLIVGCLLKQKMIAFSYG